MVKDFLWLAASKNEILDPKLIRRGTKSSTKIPREPSIRLSSAQEFVSIQTAHETDLNRKE